MTMRNKIGRATLGTALAAAMAAGLVAAAPVPALAQAARTVAPTEEIVLSAGTGQLVQLRGSMADIFLSNDNVADVQVRSPNEIYVFGKAGGQTSLYATDRAGRVIYSATVRVGQNLASIGDMLRLAMPEANIQATPMNGLILLTGTVAQPSDAEEAERLAQAFVGEGTQVVSRLRTATPQQVMLKVTIAEVSRSLTRNVGVNLQTLDVSPNSFQFATGRDFIGNNGQLLQSGFSTGILQVMDVLGVDLSAAVDLNENNGLVTILAEPTLTALSGETAGFLAGGEFPIPVSQSLGAVTIEYKQYGVGLAFTPYVLEDGRISMRVRPEVSELSSAGSIELNGYEVPSLTTRRAETTVELGSGQSFMIAGLLRNTGNNSIAKTPFLGNLPIIGALFRSNSFRRDETELVIVVTPYLVKPVSANQIALPTDGFRFGNDGQRVLLGQEEASRSGEARPMPVSAQPRTIAPGISSAPALPMPPAQAPVEQAQLAPAQAPVRQSGSAQPGFDF